MSHKKLDKNINIWKKTLGKKINRTKIKNIFLYILFLFFFLNQIHSISMNGCKIIKLLVILWTAARTWYPLSRSLLTSQEPYVRWCSCHAHCSFSVHAYYYSLRLNQFYTVFFLGRPIISIHSKYSNF